jgi:hypothetical protein
MDNVILNGQKKRIELRINPYFYNIELIKKALEDYGEVCSSEVSEEEMIKVNLYPKDKDDLKEDIGYEFFNYLLGLSKSLI